MMCALGDNSGDPGEGRLQCGEKLETGKPIKRHYS